jgi:hypothetical protein
VQQGVQQVNIFDGRITAALRLSGRRLQRFRGLQGHPIRTKHVASFLF